MNNERVTPKNAAKELQMDVITLRELMKREKLPIGYRKRAMPQMRKTSITEWWFVPEMQGVSEKL